MGAKQPQTIAVMGGGISGLTTAYRLMQQGYDVTIIDAAKNVGGHMQTADSGFELGTQLISTREKGIIELARELGVELDPPFGTEPKDEETVKFHINGKTYSEKDISALYAPLAHEIYNLQLKLRNGERFTDTAKKLDSMSMDEFLALPEIANAIPDTANRHIVHAALKQAMHTEFGDTGKLSALAFVDYVGAKETDGVFNLLGESDEAYQFKHGASSLIKALEAKLKEKGAKFELNTQITGVENNGKKGITLQTRANNKEEQRRYDYAISALSLQNLRNIKGIDSLGLSQPQLDAIHNTEYANLVKICIPTKSADIDDTIYMDLSDMGLKTQVIGWQNGEGKGGENGSITFYCADLDAHRMQELIPELQKRYAMAAGKNVNEIFTQDKPAIANWQGSGKGCFSMPTKGQFINQHTLKDMQPNAPFGLVSEAVPVLFESEDKARGLTSNTGCMNNTVEAAGREANRAVEQLAQEKEAQRKKTIFKTVAFVVGAAAVVVGVVLFTQRIQNERHKTAQQDPQKGMGH